MSWIKQTAKLLGERVWDSVKEIGIQININSKGIQISTGGAESSRLIQLSSKPTSKPSEEETPEPPPGTKEEGVSIQTPQEG